jgi:hypothetical protein
MAHKPISYNDKEELTRAILAHENFVITDIDGIQPVAAEWLKKEMKRHGLRSRTYFAYRKAILAGVLIPTGVTQLTALAGAVGILGHNLATLNPDYEICKQLIGDGIEVTYRRT